MQMEELPSDEIVIKLYLVRRFIPISTGDE